MAAKQGLSAHLSQASEDAKRAVLSRTTLTTSSWFSNLNTVCTIKSAPPKTPDVLQLLATKSGWLYKRNEQHVWQARWCCVVPHTFLYYFDATPTTTIANSDPTNGTAAAGGAGASQPVALPQPTAAQQEEWNKAIQQGKYGKPPRSNFSLFGSHPKEQSHCEAVTDEADDPVFSTMPPTASTNLPSADASKYTSLQPAGIIDLECYTRIHRSQNNPLVLELAGDDSINPDLRQFYFSGTHLEDADDWSDALLNQRHASLVDECDAYKQVCDGFAQQLQELHSELDQAKQVAEEAQDELYRVRSQLELERRQCWSCWEDVLERSPTSPLREEYATSVDQARRQDLGVATAMQLLKDYTVTMALDLQHRQEQLETQLQQSGQSDQEKVLMVERELHELQAQHLADQQSHLGQMERIKAQHQQTQTQLEDVQKELASTRMEMTMYQTQQKQKTNVLQEHKRILKKEVIDLRTKLDDALAEVSALKQEHSSSMGAAQQEREKNVLLERYVEKIESQVKVQQNMMEIMSHSAACSVYGGSVYGGGGGGGDRSVVGSVSLREGPSDFQRNVMVARDLDGIDTKVGHIKVDGNVDIDEEEEGEDEDDDDENDDEIGPDKMVPIKSPTGRRLFTMEDDAKSHMSELTEDRTQRHFDNYRESFSPYQDPSPRQSRRKQPQGNRSPNLRPPPYVIGGGPAPARDSRRQNHDAARNGKSSSNSLPPSSASSNRRFRAPKGSDNHDAMSTSSEQRLSVAQKARMEANERSTSVPVWIDETVEAKLKKKKSLFGFGRDQGDSKDHSLKETSSHGSGLWRHVEDAILGPRPEDMLSDSGSVSDEDDARSRSSTSSPQQPVADSNRHSATEKSDKNRDTDSQSSMSLSIMQRAQMQRAKQMEFLRQQGLINSEKDVPKGAGSVK